MANTFNLNLEEINANDTIKTDFIEKLNNNMSKLDDAFGLLKLKLMNKTEKTNLNDAIDEFVSAEDSRIEMERMASIGDALPEDILYGKTACVQGQEVTGTLVLPKIIEAETSDISSYTSTRNPDTITFTFEDNIEDYTRFIILAETTSSTTLVDSGYNGAFYTYSIIDTSKDHCFALYHSGRDYQSYNYKVTTFPTLSKNGNILTVTSNSASYQFHGYSYAIKYRCIAIKE